MGKTENVQRNQYSVNSADYQLLEEIGYGASATVFRAIYRPLNHVVAIKSLDLDRCFSNLDDIRREAQTMSLIDHPNVVKAFCSFVVERNLWVVMPFMAEGSCLHLMKTAYPDGIEEPAICSILKETLKALNYLHGHGHIHRDVKAGNILLDTKGLVKLADFGVSACMFDSGDRQRSRNTFVGTPCWMAPEVLQPGSGYNFKADIWSFGITALELAHGHAPFSKYPPMKVLLMTIQNAPPGLDYDRDKKFSKAFKEMVAMCLVKDQSKRPTAEKLLKHSFFKYAKPPELSVKKLYADLPPLWDRVKAVQLKDAAQLALKRMPTGEEEAISQSEYKRGVSAWNFDIEDLKAQASLVHDEDDDFIGIKEGDESIRSATSSKDLSESGSFSGKSFSPTADVYRPENESQLASDVSIPRRMASFSGPLMLSTRASSNNLSAPIKSSGGCKDSPDDKSKASFVQVKGRFSVTSENVDFAKGSSLRKSASVGDWVSMSKQAVTKDMSSADVSSSILFPHLQSLFQQTAIQQDLIASLVNSLQQSEIDGCQDGKFSPVPATHTLENGCVETTPPEREQILAVKILDVQARMADLCEELNAEKQKYVSFRRQRSTVPTLEEDEEMS
ncbi:serine/threonine-protein kinase BLUS1-like [Silene latifolia]|uniref:serine/threonine-protein kinase BLUS1-like n=1 Tax=Silene latifolia TaxID=37657 RepID=UPI003D7713C8